MQRLFYDKLLISSSLVKQPYRVFGENVGVAKRVSVDIGLLCYTLLDMPNSIRRWNNY